jgi:hypothetical protein
MSDFPIKFQNINVVTTIEFSICYKAIRLFFFHKIQISTKCVKFYSNSLSLSVIFLDRIPLARHKRTNSYLQKGIKMHSVWSQNKRIKTIRAPFPQLTSLRAEQPNDRSHDYTQCRMNAWAHWVVAREPTIIGAPLGTDPGFQVRGGALKKIAPSGGRHENLWGISCEKSRFYDKKSYFFQL